MNKPLSVRAVAGFPIAVVELHGELDFSTAAVVRNALRKQLAEQPAALVIDLTHLELVATAALSVLRAAIRTATNDAAGVPVIVAAPDYRVLDALRRSGLDRQAPLAATVAEATTLAATHPAPLRHVLRQLPPEAGTLQLVRRAVTAACASWGVPSVAAEAELVAGELVTNVIEHAGTSMDVTVALRKQYLYLAIRDDSCEPPRRAAPGATLITRGRGLLIVDEVAASWGSIPADGGKIVWATIRVTGALRPR